MPPPTRSTLEGGGAALAVAVAKMRVGEAAGRGAKVAHQVHGAIGFTHEHELHYRTRRLWAWRDECGSETWWAELVGEVVLAARRRRAVAAAHHELGTANARPLAASPPARATFEVSDPSTPRRS